MRASALAALALVSSVLGGAAVLAVGTGADWVGPARTRTVIAAAPAPAAPAEQRLPASLRATARPLPGNGFDPVRIYAARAAGVVTVYALFGDHAIEGRGGQGSGFVVSRTGLVVTNAHVVTDRRADGGLEGASEVYVEFTSGDRVPARLAGWDAFADVAVLRVDPRLHPLSPVPLGDSSRVVVGEPVAAIGSPFGEAGSLAVGVVSAVDRSLRGLAPTYRLAGAIQTDAPINRGNSGGPLFDARGRVIGVNAQIESSSGTAEGVAFAIPVNAVKRALADLVERGRVAYAYVGIATEDVSPALARRLRLPVRRGALIVEVRRGPGRDAGLRGASRSLEVNGRDYRVGGDVVVAVGEHPVTGSEELVRVVMEELRPGQLVTFTIVRGSERLAVPVRVGERPDPTE